MATININSFLFTRTQPQKKLEVITALSHADLLSVTQATILRIIKETGRNRYKSRDKELCISRDRRKGNNWNSTFDAVGTYKKKIYVDLYVQYENTDTSTTEDYAKFFTTSEYRGEIHSTDRYGNPRTYYFVYDKEDKAECLRSILLQYVYNKYHDKIGK